MHERAERPYDGASLRRERRLDTIAAIRFAVLTAFAAALAGFGYASACTDRHDCVDTWCDACRSVDLLTIIHGALQICLALAAAIAIGTSSSPARRRSIRLSRNVASVAAWVTFFVFATIAAR
jgi:hypothetical protein